MAIKRWLWIGVLLVVAATMAVGSGYWAYAQQDHETGEGHMMKEGHQADAMGDGRHGGMMPMMDGDMSKEEMDQFCEQMKNRHKRMKKMRRKKTEKLSSLVNSMKQAKGTDKIESMEKVLVELVEQHNKRGKMMMGSMRSMMGSMMGMHQMGSQQRQQMMQRMQDCPMMQGMMKSGQKSESDMGGQRKKSP